MNNFVVQASVSPDRVVDLLTTAFETTTWAKVVQTGVPDTKKKRETRQWVDAMRARHHRDMAIAPLLPSGFVMVQDVNDDERREPSPYRLDRRAITDGLTRFVSHPQWQEFARENEDAVTADVFLQLCLFGEVRYA